MIQIKCPMCFTVYEIEVNMGTGCFVKSTCPTCETELFTQMVAFNNYDQQALHKYIERVPMLLALGLQEYKKQQKAKQEGGESG
jgi:hypothetical protein